MTCDYSTDYSTASHALSRSGWFPVSAPLFGRDNLGILAGAQLPNRSLLAAVRALAEITDPKTGIPRRVDYRNLDSEEFGGVYSPSPARASVTIWWASHRSVSALLRVELYAVADDGTVRTIDGNDGL
jgi:hypothetical protein